MSRIFSNDAICDIITRQFLWVQNVKTMKSFSRSRKTSTRWNPSVCMGCHRTCSTRRGIPRGVMGFIPQHCHENGQDTKCDNRL